MPTIYKSIAYAFPTSHMADTLGCPDTGGWYIEQHRILEDGSLSVGAPAVGCGNEAFPSPDDADLIALYHEADGEPCPRFKRYGNARALAAIGAMAQA